MKKIMIKILVILLVLVVAYVGFNQIDAGPARFADAEQYDTSSLAAFLKDLMPPVSFEKNNGFYRLWTLTEPPDVDIESDAVFQKYRQMHDPQFDNDKYIEKWKKSGNDWQISNAKKGNFKPYADKWDAILKDDNDWLNFPAELMDDWSQNVLKKRELFTRLKSELQVLADRYQKLVDCGEFQDFTLVVKDSDIFYLTPIPNLLAWLRVSKIYTVDSMLEALDGNWEQGVGRLLAQIEFAKKSVKTSRTLITNLIGKAVTRMSLHALISLMNQKECPKAVYLQIVDGMPPIQYEEFGHRLPLMAETFAIGQRPKKEGGLFYQVNRTQQYYYDYLKKLYDADSVPPYQWKSHPLEDNNVKTGLFWWLQNPGGKIDFHNFLEKKTGRNLFTASFKGYAVKTYYDLVRISAELHLNYTPDKPVQKILDGLQTYRTLKDTGSGKPYIWNEERQLLYGIGFDREDNNGGGTTHYKKVKGVDHAAPVILFLK
ncbi:MAG: hypothetical protein GY950_31095 [bacterium]|nr:hypothetical protein [bacterium]